MTTPNYWNTQGPPGGPGAAGEPGPNILSEATACTTQGVVTCDGESLVFVDQVSLGSMFDPTEQVAALSVNDFEWTFATTTHRDNLRSELGLGAAISGSLGSTANRVATTSGTGGSTLQSCPVSIDGSGNVSGVGTFTASGSLTFATTVGGGGTVLSSGVFGVTPATQTSLVHGGTGVCFFTTANGLTVLNGISASSSLNVAPSVWLTRASDDVWRMGTNSSNALGSLNLANLTASGDFQQRNGTSPTRGQWYNTFTSSTVNERFEVDWKTTVNECWLTTRKGTSGGSARDLVLGRDGVERLRATSSGVTASGVMTASSFYGLSQGINCADWNYLNGTSTRSLEQGSGAVISWSSTSVHGGLKDAGIGRVAGGGGITVLAGASGAGAGTIACSNLTASGTITHVPSSSVTLGTNGQFSIEMTSNKAGNLVYRGSDGVTRRMALTFS